MRDRKGIGGRPRHGAEAKKAPLNLRTDPNLRAQIEQLAQRDGLSLTQEAERLIRLGLERDAA
jgi:predicted HicB family RNase H-like nuclease